MAYKFGEYERNLINRGAQLLSRLVRKYIHVSLPDELVFGRIDIARTARSSLTSYLA